jgi:hypothetical protein
MISVRAPETCWAVNKRQDNKLEKLLHLVGDSFELNWKIGTFHEYQYAFLIIPRLVLLRMKNVSHKSCRETEITY